MVKKRLRDLGGDGLGRMGLDGVSPVDKQDFES
jgi:hypothetical protein